ncbi:MAG TPA: NAD-dependent epimerase/dehydratase family protein [Byssovorax sp.]
MSADDAKPLALVTGATGFLGAALVERLLSRGEQRVVALVRSPGKQAVLDAVAARHPGAPLELRRGDISTVDAAARATAGADVVYHLAAAMGGAPADLFLSTVVASKRMLDAIVASGRKPKIVLVSSFGVYGVAEMGRGAVLDERAPLETRPAKRDPYSQAKLRQETLFREVTAKHGLPLVVLRPGVIYGPRGSALSSRIGLALGPVFLSLGGDNVLPLSYVDNCAEAIAVAGADPRAVGETYNVHDDDLPTCREYLRAYEARVKRLRKLPVPYPLLAVGSTLVERYHAWSKGQLPAVFTPYKAATSWGGNRFDNSKIKSLGARQIVSTDEAMRRTFDWLASRETSAATS